MRRIVYTAITQNKDSLKEITNKEAGIEYFAYLDEDTMSNTPGRVLQTYDEVFTLPKPDMKNIRKPHVFRAKRPKINPDQSKEDSIYLWIDGSISIKDDVSIKQFMDDMLGDSDIALFEHPFRESLYEEADACKNLKLDNIHIINKQIGKYIYERMPRKHDLAECSVVLRRNTPQIRKFNEIWWEEILRYSYRDQISFPYAIWKSEINWTKIPGTIQDPSRHFMFTGNDWFNYTPHKDEET